MIVLGLTGPSGGGKGVLAQAMAKLGIPVFDADVEYHKIVDRPSECVAALRDAFGKEILKDDGSLDRKRLAAVVFCKGEEEKKRIRLLTSITHPYVLRECYAWIEEQKKSGQRIVLIDAPLLCEANLDRACDKVITVIAPREVRVARVMLRDKIGEDAARARIMAQPDDEFYTSRADYVIINDKTPEFLAREAARIINELS